MASILVLGGSSFSGNYIASRLSAKNRVVCLNRNVGLREVFKRIPEKNHNLVEYSWNLNESVDKLKEALSDYQIDIVINFAAQSMVGESWINPQDWYEANLVGLSRTINAISSHANLKKFIHFTTPEVYGSQQGWIKENFVFSPSTPYAVSRAAGDWHLKILQENFDFPVIFTRAANVYGEHQQLYRIIPRTILSALTGRKLFLQGRGDSIRSFIHIEDVFQAIVGIMRNGKVGESYHISTNIQISIFELVKKIAFMLDVKLDRLIEYAPDRPGKDFAYKLDSGKIRKELDWSDSISLDEGLTRTIRWIKSNLVELKSLPMNYVHRK